MRSKSAAPGVAKSRYSISEPVCSERSYDDPPGLFPGSSRIQKLNSNVVATAQVEGSIGNELVSVSVGLYDGSAP
jgi:hypothetical protein